MASLISVNVGLPRDIEWQGRTIHTAIWKKPVIGRVMVRRLNIDGDGQGDLAGHGGEHRAVMVYQLESYQYWRQELKRDDFEYGQFGENLTVDGLADREVCIGDRYRIGTALLEVTQPRVTCYRVGIRMNNPQMPALLVSHRRPGFYLRVIEEGEIGAGDGILKVLDGPEHLSVAETDALLYLPDHPGDELRRALLIPSLSTGWQESFKTLAAAQQVAQTAAKSGAPQAIAAAPAWRGFRPLRIANVHQESLGVLSFIFESEDQATLPAALPGQFLVFRLWPSGAASSPILRSYSISGPHNQGTYRVSVKRDSGTGSQYFHDALKAGDLVEVAAPRGNFILLSGSNPVVFLSTGIGATPLLSMLYSVASRPQDNTRDIWWCYGARNGKEHPFLDEVQRLLLSLAHSHSFVTYSKPGAEDHAGKDYDVSGRLSLAELQKRDLPMIADYYLCGPAAFLTGMTADLKAWGVSVGQIHAETFGAETPITPGIERSSGRAPHAPDGKPGTGANVSFTRSGISAPWDSRFNNLLEFAEACDVPVRWSCRVGVCHTCESGLIDGEVHYSPEPLSPAASGNILICSATPVGQVDLDL
ncbi:MAG TPA: MOSC and FAD-binding oxidoreductase domain-containing protein [Acidisarcina sp.]